MPESDSLVTPLALPPPRRHYTRSEKTHVPSLTIKLEIDGKKIRVPVDAVANRAANQILLAKVRQVIDRQLELLRESDRPMDPETIKDLMTAINKLAELTERAYITGEESSPATPGDVGKLAAQIMAGAAEGVATAASKNLAQRLAEIEKLGRREIKQVVEALPGEVKPIPVP